MDQLQPANVISAMGITPGNAAGGIFSTRSALDLPHHFANRQSGDSTEPAAPADDVRSRPVR